MVIWQENVNGRDSTRLMIHCPTLHTTHGIDSIHLAKVSTKGVFHDYTWLYQWFRVSQNNLTLYPVPFQNNHSDFSGYFFSYKLFNLFKPKVWDQVKNLGGGVGGWGGAKRHPLEMNKGAPWDLMLLKVILKPINCDRMQKIRPISKSFNEILPFKNFKKMRFCHTLTYRNRRNSLNFLDTELIFWIYSSLYIIYKWYFAT